MNPARKAKIEREEKQAAENNAIAEAYLIWMFDIYQWVIDVLGVLPVSMDPEDYSENKPARVTQQQKDYLEAVSLLWRAKYYKWNDYELTIAEAEASKKMGVSVRAGKGTGKNAAESWVCAWALDCWGHTGLKIYVTAPGMDQITRDIVWPEMRKWINRQDPIGNYYCKCRDKIVIQKELIYTEKRGAGGKKEICAFMAPKVAPAQADDQQAAKTLDGLHEDYMIVYATEGDGVREPVYTALETTLTRPMNICLIGFNPTRNVGFAERTHRDDKEVQNWIAQTQNAELSPLVTRESIEKKRRHGVDSNYYRIYVLGEFPLATSNSIIKWEWLIRARDNNFEEDKTYPLMMATDPGGGGEDNTANAYRRKGKVVDIEDFKGVVGKETTGEKCLESLVKHEADDCIVLRNSVGADVYMYLVKYFKKVKGIYERNKVDYTGPGGIKFYDMRAYLWWAMAEAFEQDLMDIPNDPELIAELNAPKWLDEKGMVKQVEDKKNVKKLLKRSPNKADALAATFAKGFDYARLIGRNERPDAYEEDDGGGKSGGWMAA